MTGERSISSQAEIFTLSLMLCVAVLGAPTRVRAQNIITTVAGNGFPTFSGDGGPATSASLNDPSGVAVDDLTGNLFIADEGNARVRGVDSTTGIITTVAGNGFPTFSGDGGLATSASLNRPRGVAVDRAGNLFIADEFNHRIRRVDRATGIITTVAGDGRAFFTGDGGPATSAGVAFPTGVAVDGAGNLFIADNGNARVRRVDSGSGIITTVAGNGLFAIICENCPATSTGVVPLAVALDGAGNFFIADEASSGSRVRRVNSAGIITTVAGNGLRGFSGDGGLGTSASLNGPNGVAVDGAGNLFIADFNNNRIRQVDGLGIITTVVGNGVGDFSGDGGPPTSASLMLPRGVAVTSSGNLYIGDTRNHRVRLVQGAGNISTVAGNGVRGFSGDDGPATSASLNDPTGVDVDFLGNLFIADTGTHRIRRVDSAGNITTVAGNGIADFSGDGGPATSASLFAPSGVAVDFFGNLLFIADTINHRIRRVDSAGNITTVAGNNFVGFGGDGGPATSASLNFPKGVASSGNLIADTVNHRIRRVDSAGNITTVAGNGIAGFGGDGGPATSASLNDPRGVAVDSFGNLFIADRSNHRIRRVDSAGNITTVAGNGAKGFSGDGGWATSARLAFPTGVAVDGAGNLFIADEDNNRIRQVAPAPGP